MSVFDEIKKQDYLLENKWFFVIYDKFPVSPGHVLIISKQNRLHFFELDIEELNSLNYIVIEAKNIIEKEFNPTGYNIGMNCGEHAGQTVMHFHCHVIPRYVGDMENPKGGIRHCIKGKGYY